MPGRAKGARGGLPLHLHRKRAAPGDGFCDQKLTIEAGHIGKANLGIAADSDTWLRFLARDASLASALVTLRLRLRGSSLWLLRFGRCFPS